MGHLEGSLHDAQPSQQFQSLTWSGVGDAIKLAQQPKTCNRGPTFPAFCLQFFLCVSHSAFPAVVYDPAGTYICKSTISFQVTAPLACLPTSTGPVIPQPTGNTVYLDSSVSSTVIQQITVVNSVNIVNIQNVVNINQVSCNCCYNSCNNNVLFLLLNVTVNNNNNTVSFSTSPSGCNSSPRDFL